MQVTELLEKRTAADTELTIYPSCGHVPMDDCRERFQEDLISFVRSTLQIGDKASTQATVVVKEDLQSLSQANSSM